ncbi:hypothetical protein OE88DRAFT_1739659 [Heliocybe sulcata]|uniref:Uncharacterized protein n=1 Tax=Heliocybe sulcata TaxID=5364 RepID=A0A5C3MLC4_9AGAM|nr:hypothetical protein OE88DRAFT_1739659 [Heliocybe sulcata]
MDGIISVSKLMLRHWRDIPNKKHSTCVQAYQKRLPLYLPSTHSTLVQKRWASAGKAPVYQDKHRVPKSDIPAAPAAAGLRKHSAIPLRTLNQTLLNAEEFIDLTGRVTKNVRFPVAPEQPSVEVRYFNLGHRKIRFPPDSQGFLYWHLDPDAPLLSGQVRFRITTSSDPATFPEGRDLQLPDGGTWNISLFDIARRSTYSGLRAHLICEKLVTAKVLYTALNLSGLEGARTIRPATGSLIIWKFGQKFLVDLQSRAVVTWIIGSLAGARLCLHNLFSVQIQQSGSTGIAKSSYYRPYTGRALVQFERSTLPEHKGTRTVVLRIVKVIELTKSEGSNDAYNMLEPKEGGLVMTRTVGRHWTPWSVDVDRPQPSGKPHSLSKPLRILFDNETPQDR